MKTSPSRKCGVSAVPEATSSRATFAVAALVAVSLGGCASSSFESFSVANLNPFSGRDPLRSADSNYYYGREGRTSGPITAADLIGPDGRCAYEPAPASSVVVAPPPLRGGAAPPPEDEPVNPGSNRALYFTAGPSAGGQQPTIGGNPNVPPEVRGGPRGVALSMTECEVIRMVGYTDRVEIGSDGGRRSVTLTYVSGERPGIYRFMDGRLASMERIEGLPEPRKQRQPAKKTRTAKAKKRGT